MIKLLLHESKRRVGSPGVFITPGTYFILDIIVKLNFCLEANFLANLTKSPLSYPVLVFFGHYLSENGPILHSWILKINFASKPNEFFKKEIKNLGKCVIWPIWPRLTSLPSFGLFWPLLIRKWPNPPFLGLKIHFASKPNEFFKKILVNVWFGQFGHIWPLFGQIGL